MGPRDMLQAIREYPAACARLETAQRELNQAQKALEKSELECQRLSGDYSEARRRANFSEKKSAALQAALDAYCPKLSSLAEMIRFYETVSPSLDPQGFTLFRAAKKMTGIDLYSYFAYEDSRGLFEQMDGRQLLRWLTAARFGAVDWDVVTGTCYEEAILREVDTSTPEYVAFEEKLYRKVLERMGFGDLLAPEETVKFQEKGVVQTEKKRTELRLYSPLYGELFEEEYSNPQLLTGYDLTGYQDAIRQGIEDERLPDEEERGLMTYFDGDKSVDEKVISVQMDVEEVLGSLYAVAVCQIRDGLSSGELEELKEYCVSQYADGWGESYEQRSRKTEDGELYVSFWKPDGFYICTKEELETAKAHVRPRPQRGEDSR
ncbi:hypothetical protein [uncultured Oscillibacter sp.]|uniref:hypothetical protein n=1 Tax=uncultured Oscillibacter sp. TaxID=876091 RepID=UPI002630D278|nr:hypothetical protein [uncultured Oscillibacter sp.]